MKTRVKLDELFFVVWVRKFEDPGRFRVFLKSTESPIEIPTNRGNVRIITRISINFLDREKKYVFPQAQHTKYV